VSLIYTAKLRVSKSDVYCLLYINTQHREWGEFSASGNRTVPGGSFGPMLP
jgi:hypothetical protein